MNNTAYLSFEHDLEDGWYRMKEPTGANDTWEQAINAFTFAKSQGWKVVWTGNPYYKPDILPFDNE